MKPYHSVKASIKKSLFFKPVMVYNVVLNYKAWDDPTYGHGGGEYVDAQRTIATYLDSAVAEEQCAILNKFNGEI